MDSLHLKAGSCNLTEIHGTAFRVHCLDCNQQYSRHQIQTQLGSLNSNWGGHAASIAPDGDVDLDNNDEQSFVVPYCTQCWGTMLKPDVVFFGDNVPRITAKKVQESVDDCDALLVLGSSLQVYSGLRIVINCHKGKKPVCIVNIDKTRGDQYGVHINTKCGSILPLVNLDPLA